MTASKSKTILVIEDDPDIQFAVSAFLESEGYLVKTACNGAEALELLSHSEMPNLILLDMRMPVMNGWQFALELPKHHKQTSPIVVMTAAADAEQRAKDIHATGWLGKPFDLNLLLEKVHAHQS